jgi:acyl-CoA thioesterase-1
MIDEFAVADLPDSVIGFKYPFLRFAAALRKSPVRIVAMGSSSTAGRENVVPYPHWLEMYLRRDTGNARIDVINRGRGGEEADVELDRFDPDIFAEAPSLVIWQVGTNAVFRSNEFDFEAVVKAIADGLKLLSKVSTDVILMDSQYTTAVVTDEKKPLSDRMVKRISELADDAGVDVFRRWALMQPWHVAMRELVDPADGLQLHLSNWATQNVTEVLFEQIKRMVEAADETRKTTG